MLCTPAVFPLAVVVSLMGCNEGIYEVLTELFAVAIRCEDLTSRPYLILGLISIYFVLHSIINNCLLKPVMYSRGQ